MDCYTQVYAHTCMFRHIYMYIGVVALLYLVLNNWTYMYLCMLHMVFVEVSLLYAILWVLFKRLLCISSCHFEVWSLSWRWATLVATYMYVHVSTKTLQTYICTSDQHISCMMCRSYIKCWYNLRTAGYGYVPIYTHFNLGDILSTKHTTRLEGIV